MFGIHLDYYRLSGGRRIRSTSYTYEVHINVSSSGFDKVVSWRGGGGLGRAGAPGAIVSSHMMKVGARLQLREYVPLGSSTYHRIDRECCFAARDAT